MVSYTVHMRLDEVSLQTLQLFVAVADHGSIGAGARSVEMAQPNASHQITDIETRLNTLLLHRSPQGSVATHAGMLFAAHAREVLHAAEQLTAWMASNQQAMQQVQLHVGASLTIADALLPRWLTALQQTFPKVHIDVAADNSSAVIHAVRQGDLDLGFIETPYVPVGLNTAVIQDDELIVATAPWHPWAHSQRAISLEELAETPLVVREQGSGTRDGLDKLLRGHHLAHPTQILASNTAVRVAVTAGAGPAVLSRLTIQAQLAAGQ